MYIVYTYIYTPTLRGLEYCENLAGTRCSSFIASLVFSDGTRLRIYANGGKVFVGVGGSTAAAAHTRFLTALSRCGLKSPGAQTLRLWRFYNKCVGPDSVTYVNYRGSKDERKKKNKPPQ